MATVQKTREIILTYQQKHNIPDRIMCDAFGWDEDDWRKYKTGHARALTIYEQIMFMEMARVPLP